MEIEKSLFHGMSRFHTKDQAYLFLNKENFSKEPFLYLKENLPIPNGQFVSIEGVKEGKHLYFYPSLFAFCATEKIYSTYSSNFSLTQKLYLKVK